MRSLTFDELFAMLSAVQLSAADLARLREWIASIAHPSECITHEAVNVRAGVRARGAIHLQNVNSWHSRFKRWLVRFRGVASRYLINYYGWLRVLDDRRLTTPVHLLCAAVQLG